MVTFTDAEGIEAIRTMLKDQGRLVTEDHATSVWGMLTPRDKEAVISWYHVKEQRKQGVLDDAS